jgi:chemotaxis protein methyltransferase CheR
MVSESALTFVRELVYSRAAIVLPPGKEYLIESRLAPLAKDEGYGSIEELVSVLKGKGDGDLRTRVVEAMTTTETSFFRDIHPFEALKRKVLPELVEARKARREITIWCGASSTGQEPYSLAMLWRETFPHLANWNFKVVATDINSVVLDRAKEGRYRQIEVNRGLPAALLVKYFEAHGPEWQIRPEIRQLVQFLPENLIAPSWTNVPTADLVMLRNVLIYFDVPTKRDILGKVRRVLRGDGVLFLGGAETTLQIDENWERLQDGKAVFYKPKLM